MARLRLGGGGGSATAVWVVAASASGDAAGGVADCGEQATMANHDKQHPIQALQDASFQNPSWLNME